MFTPLNIFGMCPAAFSELTELGLPNRTITVLYRAGIYTKEILESKTEKELMDIPCFGGRSLREVKATLVAKGLSLADTPDPSRVD